MEHERVLGVFAHPDDADVGSGGTLAHLAAEGASVSIVVATLGGAGGFCAEGQDRISDVRRQEQLDSAADLGIESVNFLGYIDGELRPTVDVVRDIVAQIRIHRPTLVVTMSPEHNWTSVSASHPDHRAVGEATIQAVYPAARNPFAFRELLGAGLEPWTVEEIWLQGHQQPNYFFELSAQDMEKKLSAVARHESQFEDTDATVQYVREVSRQCAVSGGLGTDRFAEDFLRYSAK
ncbi:PIG-L deacetylase family protein [Actinomycetaceae bacterium L2_0104]